MARIGLSPIRDPFNTGPVRAARGGIRPPWGVSAKRFVDTIKTKTMPASHFPPCDDIIILKEKVASLEDWRTRTEADLKDIRDIISQVKLLMTLSIGGGGLSVITLIVTLIELAKGIK